MGLSETDKRELRALEESLWRTETRFDREHMEAVLALDFLEFGRSGRVYAREDTLGLEPTPIDATLEDWSMRSLDEATVQVTYVSRLDRNGIERSNRSSIWSRTDSGWQLRFHQGTPAG